MKGTWSISRDPCYGWRRLGDDLEAGGGVTTVLFLNYLSYVRLAMQGCIRPSMAQYLPLLLMVRAERGWCDVTETERGFDTKTRVRVGRDVFVAVPS